MSRAEMKARGSPEEATLEPGLLLGTGFATAAVQPPILPTVSSRKFQTEFGCGSPQLQLGSVWLQAVLPSPRAPGRRAGPPAAAAEKALPSAARWGNCCFKKGAGGGRVGRAPRSKRHTGVWGATFRAGGAMIKSETGRGFCAGVEG